MDGFQLPQYVIQPDGSLAPAAAEPTQTPEQHKQDRLFTADPTIRGQLDMGVDQHAS